ILRDYHTVGAGIGNMSAAGVVKRTGGTKSSPIETLLSVRTYLQDAVFAVALLGDPNLISQCKTALEGPAWQIFLGRKSCPPSAPVFQSTGNHTGLMEALKNIPWH